MLTLYAALSENVGNLNNLEQEIDALGPAALGVTPENLEFFRGINNGVIRLVINTNLNDELCGADGSLGRGIAAGIVDGLHRPESSVDLAVEATFARLAEGVVGAGADAFKGWLKSDTLDHVVTKLDEVKVDGLNTKPKTVPEGAQNTSHRGTEPGGVDAEIGNPLPNHKIKREPGEPLPTVTPELRQQYENSGRTTEYGRIRIG